MGCQLKSVWTIKMALKSEMFLIKNQRVKRPDHEYDVHCPLLDKAMAQDITEV